MSETLEEVKNRNDNKKKLENDTECLLCLYGKPRASWLEI